MDVLILFSFKRLSLGYGFFIAVVVLFFAGYICFAAVDGQKEYINDIRTEIEFNGCYASMAKIEGALASYALERGGKYPASLKDLVPAYLDSVPICPKALKDTYSSEYYVSGDRLEYCFCCGGLNHGEKPDIPETVSDFAFISSESKESHLTRSFGKDKLKAIIDARFLYRKALNANDLALCEDVLEELLILQPSGKAEYYAEQALVFFRQAKTEAALESLKLSLNFGFDLYEWDNLYDEIIREENYYPVSVILQDYLDSAKICNLDAVFFSFYFCGDNMSEDLVRKLCLASLNSESLSEYSILSEILLRGKLAESEGDFLLAESFYLTIRNLSCGTEIRDRIICELAEKALRKF